MEEVAIQFIGANAPMLQASVVWGTITPENEEPADAKPVRQAIQ